MDDLEDIQSEERYKEIDKLTDQIIANVQRMVDKKGGEGALLIDYLAAREVIGDVMDGLHVAMPLDYGVKTKGGERP